MEAAPRSSAATTWLSVNVPRMIVLQGGARRDCMTMSVHYRPDVDSLACSSGYFSRQNINANNSSRQQLQELTVAVEVTPI